MTKKSEQTRIALDRGTARVFDADGHLHVKRTPISKACVNEYLGREIPGWEELGLDADRRYALLRDPEELAKAADSFNNKPLLFDHNPVSADDHDHSRTVGAVSNPEFDHPYLYADLACWSGPAIRLVEDGSQKELSSAYRYTPDMTAGTYEGVRYDGVMRGISANHVALVARGRAGRDVYVQDRDPFAKGTVIMTKVALTRAAAHTQGALSMYLRPKLAQDAKVDIRPLVSGLTAKNFKDRKPVLALGLIGATRGVLAKDADLDDVAEMLDRVEEAVEDLQDTVDEVPEAPVAGPEPEEAKDASEGEILSFLEGKLSPEDIEKVRAMLSGNDVPAPMAAADTKDKPPAQDAAPQPKASDMKNYVSRPAMDAAIRDAVTTALDNAARTQAAIRETERFLRPYAGDLPALDSVEALERAACDVLGIKHAGVHPSALRVLIERTPKPGEQAPRPARKTVTQDAALAAEVTQAFPHMHRLGA